MPIYPAAVKRLIPHDPAMDPRITPRVAILHVDAGGATGADLARYFSFGSRGIESHFTIDYDGTVTQFRDTAYQADANVSANNFAVSIETQGKADGSWTDAQLASIKALLTWLHETHDVPLVQCPTWNGSGVGYHILFMQEWAGGPRSCPGPKRVAQFADVIVPWMAGTKAPASSVPPIFTKPPTPRPTPAPSVPAFPGIVRRGSKGAAVRKVQQRLKDRGWSITVDGDFGPGTDSIVRAFQAEKRLTVDGVVGQNTWRSLWTATVTK